MGLTFEPLQLKMPSHVPAIIRVIYTINPQLHQQQRKNIGLIIFYNN